MWKALGTRKFPTCSVGCVGSYEISHLQCGMCWELRSFPFAVRNILGARKFPTCRVRDVLGAKNCSPLPCGIFWEQGTVPLRSVGYVMELLPRGLGSRRNHSTEYLCAFYFASGLIMHAIILSTVCIII